MGETNEVKIRYYKALSHSADLEFKGNENIKLISYEYKSSSSSINASVYIADILENQRNLSSGQVSTNGTGSERKVKM